MITVIHNSAGSGDWVVVKNGDDTLFEGHTITPNDLVDILNTFTKGLAVKVNVNDEVMEQGDFTSFCD
jgi:hypothetical protein